MKKYLSLFVVLIIVFIVNVGNSQAENIAPKFFPEPVPPAPFEGRKNLCGDGVCQEIACMAIGCPAPESPENCPQDCKKTKFSQPTQEERDELKTQMEAKRKEIEKQIGTAREEAKQKMEDLKEKIKEEKDVAKMKIKELRIEGREKALERLDAAVLKIENLKERINTQIVKLETKGIAVAEAKDFVATAETKLNEARTKIAGAGVLFSASSNELTLENKTNLRTSTKEIQALIIESHKALKNAVKSLRDSIKAMLEDLKNATKTEGVDSDNKNN